MRFSSLLRKQRAEQGCVYITDLTGQGLLIRRDELIPGGNDAYFQPALYRDKRLPDGGQSADVLRRENASGPEYDLAGADVVSAENDVHAGGTRLHDADGAVSVVFGILQHDRTVGPLRQCAAGRYIGAVFTKKGKACVLAHANLLLEGENSRNRVGAAEGIRGPECIAVDGGAVEIGHIFLRGDVRGEGAPGCRLERNEFCQPRNGFKLVVNQTKNFLGCLNLQHLSHLRDD